ncbi:MAG: inositol monophosphatase [Deltaproteobacteria bacterium]|nr:inositol monophosphatase [Deltaproteobacteria bacterium]
MRRRPQYGETVQRKAASDPGPERLEAAARRAAERAGAILKRRWRRQGAIATKSSAVDLVTDVDRACETAILVEIGRAFPAHAVLAEESGARGDHEFLWIVDPLDGTTNFAHGYPQVSVSIALRRGAETVLGLVYDPLREETFTAWHGRGAFLNGRRLRVSRTRRLEASLLASGFPYDRREHADFYLSFFKAFLLRAQGIRRAGSAALDLCWVAAGRVDGFWEWKLKPWDTAAGALVVEEAGGRASDFRGGSFDPFAAETLASNGRIHEGMVRVFGAVLSRGASRGTGFGRTRSTSHR